MIIEEDIWFAIRTKLKNTLYLVSNLLPDSFLCVNCMEELVSEEENDGFCALLWPARGDLTMPLY